MINIEVNAKRKQNLILRAKLKFVEAVKNRDFLLHFTLILVKSLIFILLISDDNANGVNIMRVFYSMPPILVWFALISIFLCLAFCFKGKMQKWVFWGLNLLFTIVVIGDIWYFRSNSSFLNYHMFKMTSNLDNLGSSIFSMIRLVDVLFIIDLIYIAIRNIKDRKKYKVYNRNIVGGVFLLILSLVYLQYAHIKVDKLEMGFENQIIFRGSWSPNQTMSNLTPIGYHIYDAFVYIEESKPYVFSEEERKEVSSTLKSLKEDLPDNEYAGIFKGKNLIVLQWESLETFVVNQKINGQEITPNLNKLLNNSLYFDNFYEQTYNGTSSDAELMTNTSAFPVREGTTFFRYPANEYKYSLPNIFERMGYETLASHPDKGSYWNWMTNLKSMGYNECLDSTDYNIDEQINLGLTDKSYLRQFTNVLKEQKNPFLAYTITLTSHSPFDMPDSIKELELPENIEGTKLGGYFHAIHYTDKYIGEMIDELEKSSMMDNTVIAIYGDHEGVHKFYDDEIQKIDNLEDWMKENNRKVPLVIYSKGMEGKVSSVYGGQIDTLPTLAYLFGADKDEYKNLTLGRNLLNTKEDYVILSTREFLGNNTSEEKKKNVESLIDISDKMIRGNYYKSEEWLND